MTSRAPAAVLIGFQDQENLGLGYLAAVLRRRGHGVRVLDFREGFDSILHATRQPGVQLLGFSLIFQYFLPHFGQLASGLRTHGVRCHFCAGGHYPSLRFEDVLRAVPALDCVVLGEGEQTLPELLQCVVEGRDWHGLPGIAYRNGTGCVATPPRPPLNDLDELPFPERDREPVTVLGKKCSPLLASRGCARDCSFCSIRQFYSLGKGRRVRVRRPGKVVEEMKLLHAAKGVSVFLFQDDDFPVWGAFGRRWLAQFVEALHAAGLAGRCIWKISCRADEVELELFAGLRAAGLYYVYLGLESGNPAGLRVLNKGLTIETSLRAVSVLKELELAVGYGFMMFDPSSTFESVRANAAFLRAITGDGSLATIFCRMLPYAGTAIEASLARQGRLRGDQLNPDYVFLNPGLQSYYEALHSLTSDWFHGLNSLAHRLDWAWQEYWILRRLFPPVEGLSEYALRLRSLTREANEFILRLVETSSQAFERGEQNGSLPTPDTFRRYSRQLSDRLLKQRNACIRRNQTMLFVELRSAEVATGPAA